MNIIKNALRNTKLYAFCGKFKFFTKYYYSRLKLKRINFNVDVISIETSIEMIIKQRLSVIRFGDGEIQIINKKSISGYQDYDQNLANSLTYILELNDEGLLVCLPDTFKHLERYVPKSEMHWTIQMLEHREVLSRYCRGRVFGNAFLSRPYMIFKDKSNCETRFNMLKQVWDNEDIVIIEGELSRSGVGNNLFDNARSIERILCPSSNAYDKFDEILFEALKLEKSKLILVALGVAAKPLVYELYKEGYWIIDIGHIDSEYEWFLTSANVKTIISNKHTAEVLNDGNIGECDDPKYKSQIITYIGNDFS
ncbi:TPA: SP_1767 family glycosyltransferase [Bacillus cereus]|uniref:SP_1767 family glycosyltransferase n=1 Tax=Bacillus cereus group TaxID=86661 RepID=UPI0009B50735|nr:SP_1767 family glycosyltransferase [Bacillus pacificus]MCU5372186.1 SP_1767 family glycosyltransferase [Bacillus pacificus]